jgi:putative transposase
MPNKHIIRSYAPESYYHIYNRGVNKQVIFEDKQDYAVFLNIIKRYLDKESYTDIQGRKYSSLKGEIELLAFCLQPNHFHLLVYQLDQDATTKLMRALATSYTIYFNKKYKRVGHLFQDKYRASHITDDAYLLHISRYIHLNPEDYKNWEWSSLPYFIGKKQAGWLNPERIIELFDGEDYMMFIDDYKNYKETLETIEPVLADI